MQEIVVIDGEITLENVLDGEVELEAITDLDPEVVLSTGGAVYPHYSGSYEVTPSSSVQTLQTTDMVMDDDVTIEAVPQGSATTPQTIITANPTISVSSGGLITATVSKTQQITPTVVEGYVSAGTAGNVGVSGSATEMLDTQAAQTIHPASTDQSIASGKYLTGAQTFKAVTVSGLTADKVLTGTTVEIGDSDDSDRIMKVVGTASGGITPTGTKQITANGTSIDVYNYQYADVAVPNSYSAGDEGKVVSNGALVAQTSDTVTANDTYDTTLINSLTVDVSGGGKVTKTLTNILGNSTTLTQGFFANNGTISAPVSPRNEVTTDFIDISAYQGQQIYFWSKTGGMVAPWVTLFWYNSEKTSISSRVSPLVTANNAYTWNSANTGFCHLGNNVGSFASGSLQTVPANAKYVRASFRTGGAGMMCAVLASEITPSDYWSRDIDEIAFVNAIESDGDPA